MRAGERGPHDFRRRSGDDLPQLLLTAVELFATRVGGPAPPGLVTAMRRLPFLLALLALGAALVLAGCGGGGADGGGADAAPVSGVTRVAAKSNRFTPAAIQVPVGTTVTWTFEDTFAPHDVTGDGWRSGEPRRKGSFAHTFNRPGTYAYRCTVHDGMRGRVVVTGS